MTVLLALGGCTFDDQLPVGAEVPCNDSGDCPSGSLCGAAGHCVSETRPIRNVDLQPPMARAGQVVRLTFVAEFATASPPLVRAVHRATGEVQPFTVGGDGFEFLVDGAFPQGPWDVLVDLKDTSKHTFLGVVLGSFELDFEAPQALGEHLQYVAPPDNFLVQAGFGDAVGAAGQGTRVVVDFETTERTFGPALDAWASDAGPSIHFDRLADSTPTRHLFATTIGTPPDGDWQIVFTGADAVGNRASQTLQVRLITDATPPAAPDVNLEGAVVLRRELAGGPDAGRQPRQTVRFANTLGAAAVLSLVNGASTAATLTGNDGGAARLEFKPLSEDDAVFVRALDVAGNASPAAKVRDIEWVAWLGLGATLNSPHQALPRIEQQPALRLDRERSTPVPTGWPIEVEGGVSWHGPEAFAPPRLGPVRLDLEAGALRGWLPAGDGFMPDFNTCTGLTLDAGCVGTNTPVQTDAGLLYVTRVVHDALHDEVLVGVAYLRPSALLKVRAQSNGTFWGDWLEPAPPLPLIDALAYDYGLDTVLLLGHRTSDAGVAPEMWSFSDGWTQVDAGPLPASRSGAIFASDPFRGGAWLAGGVLFGTTTSPTDLWRWDGANWTQILDGGVACAGCALAVHPPSGDVYIGSFDRIPFAASRFDGRRLVPFPSGLAQPTFTSWAALDGAGLVAGLGQNVIWGVKDRAVQLLASPPRNANFGLPFAVATGPDASVIGVGATVLGQFSLDAGWQLSALPDSGVVTHVTLAAAVDEQRGLWTADEGGVWSVDAFGWVLRNDGFDAGVVRGLSPAGQGVLRLTSTATGAAQLDRVDATGTTRVVSLDRFQPLALTQDAARGRTLVLGSSLIERTSGLQSEGLALLAIVDGGVLIEQISVESTTETPGPADVVSLARVDDQQLLVASNKGMRWLALDARSPPAVVARVDTSSLHVPAGAVVRSIRYVASGGADGVEAGQVSPGIDVAQWLDGRWVATSPTGGRHLAPSMTPAELELLETRPEWLRRLLRRRQPLGWALTSRRSAAFEASRLSVSWISIEVSYRSPP